MNPLTFSLCGCRAVGRPENPRGACSNVVGVIYPLVGIRLSDLPKSGGGGNPVPRFLRPRVKFDQWLRGPSFEWAELTKMHCFSKWGQFLYKFALYYQMLPLFPDFQIIWNSEAISKYYKNKSTGMKLNSTLKALWFLGKAQWLLFQT